MMILIWLLVLLGAGLGGLELYDVVRTATGAPQQAAGAAMAMALAVIPYVVARAIMAIAQERVQSSMDEDLTAARKALEQLANR